MHVQENLKTLQSADVQLKHHQCDFFVQRIKYLHDFMRPERIEIDQVNINALQKLNLHIAKTYLRISFGL